jgi:hypothetical protein
MAEYKLYGTKNQGERVNRVILEGSSSNPVRTIEVGGDAVELTEQEAEALLARGLDLRVRQGSGSEEEPKSQPAAPEEAEPQKAPEESFVTPTESE